MVRPRPPKRARPVITVRPQPCQEVEKTLRLFPMSLMKLKYINYGTLQYIAYHCMLWKMWKPPLISSTMVHFNHKITGTTDDLSDAPPSTRSRIQHRRNHACGCPRCQWHPGDERAAASTVWRGAKDLKISSLSKAAPFIFQSDRAHSWTDLTWFNRLQRRMVFLIPIRCNWKSPELRWTTNSRKV